MARIKPGNLGTPSGKVGNTVFRKKNKKILAYQLNEAYNKSNSVAALKNEDIFTRVTKFSNFVNKPVIIKKVWKFSKAPGTYTNLKIYKYNYKNIRAFGITSDCHILPQNFYYGHESIKLKKDKLSFEFSVSKPTLFFKKQTETFDPPYVFIALIHAENPVSPDNQRYSLNVYTIEKSDSFVFNPEGTSIYTFAVNENSFPFIDDYNTVLVFPAIVSVNEPGKIYKWAEYGGFYIKGSKPSVRLYKPEPPPAVPDRIFLTDY